LIKSIMYQVVITFVIVFFSVAHCHASQEHEWFVSVYGGEATDNTLYEIIFNDVRFANARFLALVLGKNLTTYKDLIRFEAEGQVVKYWGAQDNFEFNGVLLARWLPFPWDHYLDTSVAVGEGFSYATEDPEVEVENDGKTSKFLNYLAFELDFVIPGAPNFSLFSRVHHRSGIFGLINGVHGGSNALGVGIKYSF